MAMNWVRNSPLRMSFGRRGSSVSPPKDCDPSACFESFKRHWQQAFDIIGRTQSIADGPSQDDVLGVVNNLEQLLQLLILELRGGPDRQHCLEYLLSEKVLEQLLTWSTITGRYNNVLRLEQLKLYEMLLSNAPQNQLLTHEPFLRPMLTLLTSCLNECFPADIEKRLILLLNQLCVCLMQNPALLDLFFSPQSGPARFVIFALLIPYVHREGGIGHQARDAMLLCMSLSKKNQTLGLYIAEHSQVCPVLATGLSGLYSRLPRKLAIEAEDWHCFTPDDVNEMPELTLFLNSLEFCNAVVQVAHPLVQTQMLEFLYHGFLVPVVGPALLQDSEAFSIASSDPTVQRSVAEELVASTAYLNLFLSSVTEPGLLHTFLRFLVTNHYDGERVLDKMVQRIGSKSSRLCLVTISLFETLINFNCEDVLLELVFQYLIPCTHVMLSQRKRIKDIDTSCKSTEKFLSLSPSCCISRPSEYTSLTITPPHRRTNSISSEISPNSPRRTESLQGNYCAYLCDAHKKVKACTLACATWNYPYDGDNPEQAKKSETKSGPFSVDNNRNFTSKNIEQNLPSLGESSGYESFACREESRESSLEAEIASSKSAATTEHNPSLLSSSSTKDSGISFEQVQQPSTSHQTRFSSQMDALATRVPPKESSYMEMFNATPDIGQFLDLLLRQLENMMNNSLYLNLHITGLITRLAAFPQPLLSSFLLNHSLVFQPSVRSLFQVLGSLKQQIDSYLNRHDNVDELVCEAQVFLVGREERIVNARRLAQDSGFNTASGGSTTSSRRGSNPEPFARGEPKRKSFSSALSSVYKRVTQSAFHPVREHAIEYSPNGYRYTKRSNDAELRRVVMSAVLLDEWLKELAALSQEHVACYGLSDPTMC